MVDVQKTYAWHWVEVEIPIRNKRMGRRFFNKDDGMPMMNMPN